jgi:hypothetical protein
MVVDMNNDRELLELAAKAVGMEFRWDCPRGAKRPIGFRARLPGSVVFPIWQPLHDDGDAFRLAVDLKLDICRPTAHEKRVCVWVDHMGDFIEEHEGIDPRAATRRAIVRAAAEIGRQS